MVHRLLACCFLSFLFFPLFGQGNLVLLGEDANSPNRYPQPGTAWAFEHSDQQTLALIGSQAPTTAYLDSLALLPARVSSFWCYPSGRAETDSLTQIALKGYQIWWLCDSSDRLYEDLRFQAAAYQHYQNGGTLILSASRLNTFLPIWPDFYFSGHTTAEGISVPLLTRMAEAQVHDKLAVNGVQIDAETALCINKAGLGTVSGQGSVQIFLNDLSHKGFYGEGFPYQTDSLRWTSIGSGGTFHFRSWASDGFSSPLLSSNREETGNYSLFLSGSDALSENGPFLDAIVQDFGLPTEPILLIGSLPLSTVETLRYLFASRGVSDVFYADPDTARQEDPVLRNQILQTDKRLFYGNEARTLTRFFTTGSNGRLLAAQMREAGAFNAFMGADSRLAGPICWELDTAGTPQVESGLALLNTTVIQSGFEIRNDRVPLASLVQLLLGDSLRYGMALPPHAFLRYQVSERKAYFTTYGPTPLYLLDVREGQTRNEEGDKHEFANLTLRILQETDIHAGEVQASLLGTRGSRDDWLTLYPNPFRDQLHIYFYGQQSGTYQFQLVNAKGELILSKEERLSLTTQQISLTVPRLPSGIYLLQVRDHQHKIIKQLQVIH